MTPEPLSEQWMPNGFPPPSFAVDVERRTTTTFGGSRGRWLVAAAILGALLLIAGVVLLATQKEKDSLLTTGTSTTRFGTTQPTTTSSTGLSSFPTDPTGPGATGPTTPAGPVPITVAPTAAPGTTVAPGVLATTSSEVAVAKVDASVGPQSGKVSLKNTGRSALNYTSQTNFSGLTVDKPTGTIAAGASTEVTITLDGSKAVEGAFSGLVSFEGTGGTKRVTVTSTVGRPPVLTENLGMTCPAETTTCSKQILVENSTVTPPRTPCNSRWSYKLSVSDENQIKSVQAKATQKVGSGVASDTTAALKIGGATSGPSGVWQSAIFEPLPAGTTLTFTIEAADQFDFARQSTTRTIVCPGS